MDDTVKLVHRILAGDVSAWPDLQAELEPTVLRIARRHRNLRRKGLAELPDDLAEIRTATLESLANANFSNLRSFTERQAASGSEASESFASWIYGVVDFVIREHLRKRFGRAPKPSTVESSSERRPSKRELQSHAGRLDDQPERALLQTVGVTTRLTLAEIFAFIDRDFSAQEAQAARLYFVEDRSFEEIARQLGLDDKRGAERLVRRLNARLRYRFLAGDRAEAVEDQ